jgi:hypothetical protein
LPSSPENIEFVNLGNTQDKVFLPEGYEFDKFEQIKARALEK